jgi:hypothetical protein
LTPFPHPLLAHSSIGYLPLCSCPPGCSTLTTQTGPALLSWPAPVLIPLSTRTPGPASSGPVHAPTRGPRSSGPGPLLHTQPDSTTRVTRTANPHACSPNPTGAPALSLLTPECQTSKEPAPMLSLRVGIIQVGFALAIEPALLHIPPRVHWSLSEPARLPPSASGSLGPASPSAYLARVLRSQPEPAWIHFSASGTRCKPYQPVRSQSSRGFIGSSTSRPASLPLLVGLYHRMWCTANYISPSMGSQHHGSMCRHTTPRDSDGDRVNTKPLDPGHRPAPRAPSMLVNPSSQARVSKADLARPKATLCCPPPGMKMGSDSPGQLSLSSCRSHASPAKDA